MGILEGLISLTHLLLDSDFPFTPQAGVTANVESFKALNGASVAEHGGIALQFLPRLSADVLARVRSDESAAHYRAISVVLVPLAPP